jgi:hypothetical protein
MVQQGDLVITSLMDIYRDVYVFFHHIVTNASLNFLLGQATKFPNPDVVDPTRAKSTYTVCNDSYSVLADDFAVEAITEMVQTILGQKNIRRAVGDAGQLLGLRKMSNGTENYVYLQTDGSLTAWPTRMHVVVSTAPSPKLCPKLLISLLKYDD